MDRALWMLVQDDPPELRDDPEYQERIRQTFSYAVLRFAWALEELATTMEREARQTRLGRSLGRAKR